MNNPKARSELFDQMESLKSDKFRWANSQLKRLTWRKKIILNKQDYIFFLISCELSPFIQTIEYENSNRSDRRLVVLHKYYRLCTGQRILEVQQLSSF